MKFLKDLKLFRNLKDKSNLSATIALVVAIVVVLNFISYNVFLRLDLTENKDYSISKVSKKTVSNLDDVVNIKVYFSKNLPPKFANLEQEIKDIISEYENFSGGKVKTAYIDPSSFENSVEEMTKIGVAPLQFNVMRNDSYEVVQGFMGMVIQYGSKREAIPMIDSSRNLEYIVTTAIKKMTAEKKMTLGLVSSNGTVDAGQAARNLYGALEDLYDIEEVDLQNEEQTLDNIDTLLLFGPRTEFVEEDLKKLDSFVMSGRPLIMLVDGVVIDQQIGPSRNRISIDPLLEKYGLKLNADLVADTSNAMVSLPTGLFNININYPLWPKIVSDNFNKESVMVSSLESLTLPWASSIEILEDNINIEETDVTVLAKSTSEACAQTGTFDINPQSNSMKCSETNEYNFAVYLSGKINSAYEEDKSVEGRVILVSDSDFATDQFYAQSSDNTTFLQNLVDGVTLDGDLISIRSQGVTERPLDKISKGTKETIRYLNIFGMTVLVIIFGMLRYFLRRNNKLIDQI